MPIWACSKHPQTDLTDRSYKLQTDGSFVATFFLSLWKELFSLLVGALLLAPADSSDPHFNGKEVAFPEVWQALLHYQLLRTKSV